MIISQTLYKAFHIKNFTSLQLLSLVSAEIDIWFRKYVYFGEKYNMLFLDLSV